MGLWEMIKGEEPGIIDTLLHYKDAGQFGEYCTEYAITHKNISGYSKTVCNVYLPKKETTTELDVVMVHEKGIFVFESKNYSGWIFGDADQLKWTQSLPNKQKVQFYNPIKQNQTHCKALAEFLELPIENISSYIIFSNRCNLKKVPDDTPTYKIVRRLKLLPKLRKELEEKLVIFTKNRVDEIEAKLKIQANVTKEQKEKHIEDVEERTEGNICPFCGGELKLRNSKNGEFYGCSNYPKCRFTKKI